MKCNITCAAQSAPKLLTVVALSALLVACGGGTSGDTTDSGETDGFSTDGFDTEGSDDLGLTDGGTDDGFEENSLVSEFDTDGDGIPNEDEGLPCQGLGGSDPGSTNGNWDDNCFLREDIRPGVAGIQSGPFYNSTYVQGVQRVLYCRGLGGVEDSIGDFADGFFGSDTNDAVREFQLVEGLVVDGIVGPGTWGRMQVLVEDVANVVIDDTDNAYNAYGISSIAGDEINCSQMTNFFGRFNTDPDSEDTFEAWEMSIVAGESAKGAFSTATPQ